jgi:putative transcriptional regulator
MSLAPGFLIAFPHLLDPNFRQSVVLLLQQDENGAMGVVVNRQSTLLLGALCRDHEISYAGESDKRVRTGGPVRPEHGLVLFGEEHQDPEGQPVLEDLFVSASRETLSRLCSLPTGRFQCFSGHAGWGPGQLEREIGEGTWVVGSADTEMVLDAPLETIWSRALLAQGIDPAALVPGGGEEA